MFKLVGGDDSLREREFKLPFISAAAIFCLAVTSSRRYSLHGDLPVHSVGHLELTPMNVAVRLCWP